MLKNISHRFGLWLQAESQSERLLPGLTSGVLMGITEDYRQGLVPLIVPLMLLKHHLNPSPVPEWVHQQVYLHPYPKELMLRNHVIG